ncbi:MAG: Clp protease N-terminal domain-containing protein [Actinomycetota bacterium]|nr:Clp protease N-terminal domain-containing protein [Actinomycetota bacterium]
MSCLGDLKDRFINSSGIRLRLYTPDALAVPREAGRLALAMGSTSINPEHLLLALAEARHTPASRLLADSGCNASLIRDTLERRDAEALSEIGISLDDVVREIESRHGRAAWEHASSGLPSDFTCLRETDNALRAADRAAMRLRNWTRTTEHLLLALIHQRGRAHALLLELEVDVASLEQRVLGILTKSEAPSTGG